MYYKGTKFCNFSISKKRLPVDHVKTSKHFGVLYEIEFTHNILCIYWSEL